MQIDFWTWKLYIYFNSTWVTYHTYIQRSPHSHFEFEFDANWVSGTQDEASRMNHSLGIHDDND